MKFVFFSQLSLTLFFGYYSVGNTLPLKESYPSNYLTRMLRIDETLNKLNRLEALVENSINSIEQLRDSSKAFMDQALMSKKDAVKNLVVQKDDAVKKMTKFF